MPEDGQAWRDTLAWLDADADSRCGATFAAAPEEQQLKLIQAVQDQGSGDWHGLNAAHVWRLWTRYACTALYAHPLAWNAVSPGRPTRVVTRTPTWTSSSPSRSATSGSPADSSNPRRLESAGYEMAGTLRGAQRLDELLLVHS